MLGALAYQTALLEPAKIVLGHSLAAMDSLSTFQMDIETEAKGVGGVTTQKFRVISRRPDAAKVQALRQDGSVSKEVIITPEQELVADYDLAQSAVYPRSKKQSVKDAALFRIPSIDPFVFAMIDKKGWASYLKESSLSPDAWIAAYSGTDWVMETTRPNGRVKVYCRPGDFMPTGMDITSSGGYWNWKIKESKVEKPSFALLSGTRRVVEIAVPQAPTFIQGDARPIVEKMWRAYDRPRPIAVEIKDAKGNKTRVLTDGFRIRQTSPGLDWGWDGRKVTITRKGKTRSFEAKYDDLVDKLASADVRLDPTFGSLVLAENPFRAMLALGKVTLQGEVDLPTGKAVLLMVKGGKGDLSMAVSKADGRVLSISSMPSADGSQVFNMRTFTYLPSSLADSSSFTVSAR